MEDPSDAAVISRSLVEPAAFALLFDRHYDAIHRYLARRVGWDIADDLTAETFATALGARGRYELTRPDARPWLYGIATRLLSHHRRSEGRRLRAYARLDRPSTDDGGLAGSEHRMDAAAAVDMLAVALERLSPGDRDVVLLYAWADLTYAQIGQALDIPVGTVRSRLHRARGRLREPLLVSGRYPVDDAAPEVTGSHG